MSITVLGISAYYHDSACALLKDGKIIAAAQEERFTRIKHDAQFPRNALVYCLKEANLTLREVDYVVFYDKPFVKFERLLETYLSYAPKGFTSFLAAMPIWIKEKLFLKTTLNKELSIISGLKKQSLPTLLFNDHHRSHAASAFYPSPFSEAAVLCLDGVGEWATSSVWIGKDNTLSLQWELTFPHSLGLLYSAMTYYCGFKVNSGEYKLMGLAPYGEPLYVDLIKDELIDLKEDGTFRLNMKYFNFATGLTMTNKAFDALFGGPARQAESDISQKEMDLARSIQVVTEEIVLRLARTIHLETGLDNLCLAGGVALNCVANGRLLREGPFKNIWIQPAAGDAGGALGAAMCAHYEYKNQPRNLATSEDDYEQDESHPMVKSQDSMQGGYLGPSFSQKDITHYLDCVGAKYQVYDEETLNEVLATILAQENVVGRFAGRMEFGPRALGNRSIIGDARSPKMQSVMNLKIKYRESFRPFAPAIKADKVGEWFEHQGESPYMLMVAPVREDKCYEDTQDEHLFGIEKLNCARSIIPAVTHVDYSARIQTVHPETNPQFYALLDEFEKVSNCPILINTSFNVRGEPIVCTPEDAYRCFMRTQMDYLVLENVLLKKSDQPNYEETQNWQEEFTLD